MTYSLRQLFAVITVWCVCIAGVVAFYSSWFCAWVVVAAVVSSVVIVFKPPPLIPAIALLFPLVCIANGFFFAVALSYAFDGNDQVTTVLGPFAQSMAWPMIVVQNNVGLAGAGDTLVGFITLTLAEIAVLSLIIVFWRHIWLSSSAVA